MLRSFSNYILTEIARFIDFCHTRSGWFDWTEPSPTTSLQRIQGVQGAICTGAMRFKHIEPHRTLSNCIFTEIARCIDFFYMSSGWFDWTEPSLTTSLQEREGLQGAICTSSMRFKHSALHRTFSNYILTEIARYRDFLHTSSGWFDCTEPSQTTSLQGIQGVQGALCTGSGRFKHIEPHRTLSNCIFTETARYREFFYTRSGWFDWTEPSLTTSLKGVDSVQGAICTSWMRFKHIEPHRTFLICILTEIARYVDFFHTRAGWFDCTEPSHTTALQGIQGVQGALYTGSGRFKHSEPHRTFSHCIFTEIARCIDFFYMSSGWFDWTEPSLTTSLQEREGMQRAICTSWMRFKHIEPHRSFMNYILTEIARYRDFFHSSSGWFDCTAPSPTTSLQGIQGVQEDAVQSN